MTTIREGRAVETGPLAEMRHLTLTAIDAEVASVPPDRVGIVGVPDLAIDGARYSRGLPRP